jgi:DNA modification methylase
MGTGTTAVGCGRLGKNCIGFELSEAQVQYTLDRLKSENIDIFKLEEDLD